MKSQAERIKVIAEAVKGTESPIFWLSVAVKQGEVTEAEAGYIIIHKLTEAGKK